MQQGEARQRHSTEKQRDIERLLREARQREGLPSGQTEAELRAAYLGSPQPQQEKKREGVLKQLSRSPVFLLVLGVLLVLRIAHQAWSVHSKFTAMRAPQPEQKFESREEHLAYLRMNGRGR
jgi:hypothetical protein